MHKLQERIDKLYAQLGQLQVAFEERLVGEHKQQNHNEQQGAAADDGAAFFAGQEANYGEEADLSDANKEQSHNVQQGATADYGAASFADGRANLGEEADLLGEKDKQSSSPPTQATRPRPPASATSASSTTVKGPQKVLHKFVLDRFFAPPASTGLRYRRHKVLGSWDDFFDSDLAEAPWGSVVVGSCDGDGWICTPSGLFLPMAIDGSPTARSPSDVPFEKMGNWSAVKQWQAMKMKHYSVILPARGDRR